MIQREDPASIERERRVADKLAHLWRCEWGRMGQYSPVDVYFMRQREVQAFAEIKTRQDTLPRPTVLLDIQKWFALINIEIALGKPSFYVVAFTDGIVSARIGTLKLQDCRLVHTGRADRQTAADQRPAITVPTGAFTRVCDSTGIFNVQDPSVPPYPPWPCPHTPSCSDRNACRILAMCRR